MCTPPDPIWFIQHYQFIDQFQGFPVVLKYTGMKVERHSEGFMDIAQYISAFVHLDKPFFHHEI